MFYSIFSQNGVVTVFSPKEVFDTSIFANSTSPNRDIQYATNGLTMPQSPKPLVPDICIKTGHKFSNFLPMFGYCKQCSERVLVGMLFKVLIKIELSLILKAIVSFVLHFFFYFSGVKCKICKFRYHKGCLSRVQLHCTKSSVTDDIDATLDGELYSYIKLHI